MERTYQIVVALDFTALSDRALEQALALCSHHPRAKLHVITVGRTKDDAVELPGNTSVTLHATDVLKSHVLGQIERYRSEHGPFSLAMVAVYIAVGRPASRIVALSQRVHADVIVMGSHGRQGWQKLLEGSVAEEVVREAKCGVYVVHEGTRKPPESSFPPPAPEDEIEVIFEGEPG
jgi:nucleotide-binding universal stress UspA family protein